jgi:hypothetical protein
VKSPTPKLLSAYGWLSRCSDDQPKGQPKAGSVLVSESQSVLDDRTPARLLREGDFETDGAHVIGTARQFVAVG